MKNSLIHTKNNTKKTLIIYFCCLIPLVLYGIYKNGYLLYTHGYIGFIEIFKTIYLILIALIINRGLEFLLNKKIRLDYSDLNVVILSLFMMPNINLILYLILIAIFLFISKLIYKKFHFNYVALICLIMSLGMFIIGNYSFCNIAEANNIYAYDLMDLIWGRNVGGMATSSILIGVIIYAILTMFANFKKAIPALSYLMYIICTLIIMTFTNNYDYNLLFNSTVILNFILVGTDTLSTPYTLLGILIYAILLGTLTAILSVFLPFEGVFISVLLLSIISPIIDKLFNSLKK